MKTLFLKPGCPFCARVLAFAREQNIALAERDIVNDPTALPELLSKGGKRQVPFLVDEENNTAMYESDDIIEYLKNNA